MTWWEVTLTVLLGLLVNECCDVSPWLARRLVRWSARRRYGNSARGDTRAEELVALIDDRPGKILKVLTATGFAVTAVAAGGRRGARPVAEAVVQRLIDAGAGIRLPRRRSSLMALHELISALNDSSAGAIMVDVLLVQSRGLLRSQSATLWLPTRGRHPEVLLTARRGFPGLIDLTETPFLLHQRALQNGKTVVVRAGSRTLRDELPGWDGRAVIVVPLRSGPTVFGTMGVVGPVRGKHFSARDVRLLEMVAVHAAVAVENSRLVDRLRYDAYHDRLTGLPNRRRILDAIAEHVAHPAVGTTAILLFDITGMRGLNSTLGRDTGDRVLAEVATRLRDLAPPDALVGRTGSDEFAVVLPTESAEAATDGARSILEGLQGPVAIGSKAVPVDCTVGVVLHPSHGDRPEELLHLAELAAETAGKPAGTARRARRKKAPAGKIGAANAVTPTAVTPTAGARVMLHDPER